MRARVPVDIRHLKSGDHAENKLVWKELAVQLDAELCGRTDPGMVIP
jgi:hypothetical protein